MSARPKAFDMRLPGESFCADCPDHEACATGAPCWEVRRIAVIAAGPRSTSGPSTGTPEPSQAASEAHSDEVPFLGDDVRAPAMELVRSDDLARLREALEQVRALADQWGSERDQDTGMDGWDAGSDARRESDEEALHAILASVDAPAPEVCTCFVTPESTWLSAASCGYGSGYEPGSQMEWNPDCPVHGDGCEATLADRINHLADHIEGLHAELPQPHGPFTNGYRTAIRDVCRIVDAAAPAVHAEGDEVVASDGVAFREAFVDAVLDEPVSWEVGNLTLTVGDVVQIARWFAPVAERLAAVWPVRAPDESR